MKYVLFSFDGRINRAQYWQTGILPLSALAFLWGLMCLPIFYLFPFVGILVSIGAILCLVWGFTAASIKRCHDTGHSGFWTLLYLIPGVALVGLIVLGAWRSSGPNRYDHAEDVPALLRKGKIALAPLLILSALFVFYWPLWEPSFVRDSQSDVGGTRRFTPTPEEKRAGAEILRESGIVEHINGGQEWEPVYRVSGYTGQTGNRKLSVEAVWDMPVEHSGPWWWVTCDDPRKVVIKQRWSNITRLDTYIDLDEGRILKYDASVWGPDDEQPVIGPRNPLGLVRVYNARDGEHLITGPKIFILPRPILCTPGRYYRD